MWSTAAILVLAWCGRVGALGDAGWLAAGEVRYNATLTEIRYYEGEPVNFTCWRRPASNSTVQLSYHSKDTGSVATWKEPQDSVSMYFKLREAHNDTMITCSVQDEEADERTARLRLLLMPTPRAPAFTVNGLRLPTRESSRFEYQYMWEERMTVQLVHDPDWHDVMISCNATGNRFPGAWLDRIERRKSPQHPILVNATLTAEETGTQLECNVSRARYPGRQLRLLLHFTYYELQPFVGGLTMANVELLYKTNVTSVYYDVHAPYTGNDTHYFTCSPEAGTVSWWVWNTGEVDVNPDHYNETFPHAFRLFDSAKWTLLRCERDQGKDLPKRCVYLWLHRAPPPPAARAEVRPGVAGEPWGVVGGALLCLTLLVVAITMAVMWRRRRIVRRSSVDDHVYEYIPELAGVLAASGGRPSAPRPPCPLPPEVQSAQERYRHYDTPYEWRIFRFGKIRRCACGRCSVGLPH